MNLHIDFGVVVPPQPPAPDPYRVLRVPDTGRFMLLLDDWDTAKWGYMPRSRARNYKSDPDWNGLPATVQTQKIFYAMNEQWQRFYFECIRRSNGYSDSVSMDEMLNSYRNFVRDSGGFHDQHTIDDWRGERDKLPPEEQKLYTNWVLGLNLPPAYNMGDMAQQDLLSSGNIVKVIGEGTVGGEAAWVIETMNYKTLDAPAPGYSPVRTNGRIKYLIDPPSVDEVWGQWWKVGFATVSGYNWTTGEKRRMKWPRFGGYGCPLMFLGRDGQNRVPKYWCKPIANGAEFSLYT